MTPHGLDHDLVGEPDAQEQAVLRGHLHREGLLGQHHRMAGVDGDHPGAQADARDLRAGHGQERERVVAEDLGGKGMVEPASAKRCSCATISDSGLSVSIMLPMRSGLAMSLVLLA